MIVLANLSKPLGKDSIIIRQKSYTVDQKKVIMHSFLDCQLFKLKKILFFMKLMCSYFVYSFLYFWLQVFHAGMMITKLGGQEKSSLIAAVSWGARPSMKDVLLTPYASMDGIMIDPSLYRIAPAHEKTTSGKNIVELNEWWVNMCDPVVVG